MRKIVATGIAVSEPGLIEFIQHVLDHENDELRKRSYDLARGWRSRYLGRFCKTAAGTAGFLVAADRYIKDHPDDLYKLPEQQAFFQRHSAFTGAELVPDTRRLCLMNLLLHGIEGGVELADTLSPDSERLSKAGLVLTNPPFGTKKGGGRPTRSESSVTPTPPISSLASLSMSSACLSQEDGLR